MTLYCVTSLTISSFKSFCCSILGPAVTFNMYSDGHNITTADVAKAAGKNPYCQIHPFLHPLLNED